MEPNNTSSPPPHDNQNVITPEDHATQPSPISHPVQSKQFSSGSAILAKVAAIIFIIAGLVVGFGVGVMVSFGACYKSSCSPVESGAPLWIPAASLLVTVPIAVKTFEKYS